jgi:hypothetical protein
MRRYLLFSPIASVFVTGATGQTHDAASARRGSNSQKRVLSGYRHSDSTLMLNSRFHASNEKGRDSKPKSMKKTHSEQAEKYGCEN